jgi:type VI secretion system protein ImpK
MDGASQTTDPRSRRRENLALVYQEILTVIVRIRSNRQVVTDVEAFRANMRGVLKKAEQEAVAKGYTPEDARLATFAVVAFLDESVLGSSNPVFADWARKPLQEEMFGGHVAGEAFFQTVERLLSRKDAEELADLLEVYYLCLLLGYRGRYSVWGTDQLRGVKDSIAEKISHIRGAVQPGFGWAPSTQSVPTRRSDPWLRGLAFTCAASLLLALALFAGFRWSLSLPVAELKSFALPSGT